MHKPVEIPQNPPSGLRVLSLFDGMSGGQQALQRLGVAVNQYFASEIDKAAMFITQKNFPNTVQLGSVLNVTAAQLPPIDLLLGGSPCQSFSFCGKRKGMATSCEMEVTSLAQYLELKAEGYEFEGQSYLFWEFVRLLQEVKPTYFLLENVQMGHKWENVLSRALGVSPVKINSALVSAQSRNRLYWTNIAERPDGLFGFPKSTIAQPADRLIFLKDVLEPNVSEKYYLSQQRVNTMLKSSRAVPYVDANTPKFQCLLAAYSKHPTSGQYVQAGALRFGRSEAGKAKRKATGNNGFQDKEFHRVDFLKMNTLLSSSRTDNLVVQINPSVKSNQAQPFQQNRIYDPQGKSSALLADLGSRAHNILEKSQIRRLTPTECERLQTVADGYTEGVSDNQRYKMLGNGWTIDVIAHLLSYAPF